MDLGDTSVAVAVALGAHGEAVLGPVTITPGDAPAMTPAAFTTTEGSGDTSALDRLVVTVTR